MATPAPLVDPVLAEAFRGMPDPREPLRADQGMALFYTTLANAKQAGTKGRLAHLLCGHFVITKAIRSAKCPRCGEMIRAGYDYEAFRNGGGFDEFSWPDDPLGYIHNRSQY
jgi:hypothetical protein